MAEKYLMVIPCINEQQVTKYLWDGLDNYTFQCERKIITNRDVDSNSDNHTHISTYGTKKLSYAMDKYNPDIIIFHAIDWLLEKDALENITNALKDNNVISAGVRPWHNNIESGWRQCTYKQEAHCCSIVCAYSHEVYPYVRKVREIKPNIEVWNEACYMAVMKGKSVKSIFSYLYSTVKH